MTFLNTSVGFEEFPIPESFPDYELHPNQQLREARAQARIMERECFREREGITPDKARANLIMKMFDKTEPGRSIRAWGLSSPVLVPDRYHLDREWTILGIDYKIPERLDQKLKDGSGIGSHGCPEFLAYIWWSDFIQGSEMSECFVSRVHQAGSAVVSYAANTIEALVLAHHDEFGW